MWSAPGWTTLTSCQVAYPGSRSFIPPSLLRGSSCDISHYVDTSLLSEGAHTFRGAINQSDEVSDEFTVTIDRWCRSRPSSVDDGRDPATR